MKLLHDTKMCVLVVQEAVVGELKQKHRQIKEKKVLNRDEVYHGALEDILMGMCVKPRISKRDSLIRILFIKRNDDVEIICALDGL